MRHLVWRETEVKMPKFKVTYKCPKCDHQDVVEANYSSWSNAMGSASSPCPNHEELGEIQATKAIEIKE
jgi:transcription elongation factor Elf1